MSDQHTPGPWNVGKSGGSVVSESPLPGYDGRGGHDEISYYGGHLIAESIWRTQDVHLIAAAPELLALAVRYASECAECEGRGYVVAYADPYERGDVSSPEHSPCAECADIRAIIAKATVEQTDEERYVEGLQR